MMGYMDISNLYKVQDILLFKECFASEKIHGTSAHITWDGKDVRFSSGGESHNRFVALFDVPSLRQKFLEKVGVDPCVVYGEAYGGKCMGMSGTYGLDLRFVAFDVKIGDCWLSMPNAEDVSRYSGLDFVFYEKIPTTFEAIDAARDADSVQAVRNGMGPGKKREGVVLRPLIELTKNNGDRIIVKHKRDEFAERQNVPRIIDPARLKVLDDARAIADEWVVPMRLEHILQELPGACGMEHTRDVIKAMVADVYKEAKGEIVESKEVASAIGKRAAELWKKRVERIARGA